MKILIYQRQFLSNSNRIHEQFLMYTYKNLIWNPSSNCLYTSATIIAWIMINVQITKKKNAVRTRKEKEPHEDNDEQ